MSAFACGRLARAASSQQTTPAAVSRDLLVAAAEMPAVEVRRPSLR